MKVTGHLGTGQGIAGGIIPRDSAALEKQARALHGRLFPEEYDEFCDDIVDAALRGRGINPMSADTVARVDARRGELGFPPYTVTETADRLATLDWARDMVRQGRHAEIEGLCIRYGL